MIQVDGHHLPFLLRNVADIVGVAAIVSAQATDLRGERPARPGAAAQRDAVREEIPFWREDRYASPDLKSAARLVRSRRLLAAVERAAGPLE
jgi:histidine ammonia-lyase